MGMINDKGFAKLEGSLNKCIEISGIASITTVRAMTRDSSINIRKSTAINIIQCSFTKDSIWRIV